MAGWYWMKDGEKHGPVDNAHLKQLALTGQLQPTDTIWREGLPNWVPASQANGLEFGAARGARTGTSVATAPARPSSQQPALPRGIIKYRCVHCGGGLESEGRFAGKQDTCPMCGKATPVPLTSTMGAGAFFRKIPKAVYIGTAAVVLVAVVSLTAWLALRDTWERDHGPELRQMSEQTISLIQAGNDEEGVAKYEAMLALVGDRQIENPVLTDAIAAARTVAEPFRQRLMEERRLEEARRREADTLAKLRTMEAQVAVLLRNAEFTQAIAQADQALGFIQTNRTNNTEFSASVGRLTQAKRTAQGRLDEQRARRAEEARLAEQRRIDAENEAKGLVKVDGKWLTKEQAELARLRAEMEAMRNKPGKVVMTVTWKYNDFVGNKPDADAIVVLVPEGLQGKLPNCLAPGFSKIGLDGRRKELGEKGAYIEIAGGDGKATFNRVKPGRYTAVIVSNNTKEEPDLHKLRMRSLQQYFDDPSTIMHKVTTMEIEVLPGESFEKSYDFGLTYW